MAEEKIKIKLVGTNDGYMVKANQLVDLKMVFDGTQMTKAMKILSYVGGDFKIAANLGEEKPSYLGNFRLQQIKFDGDGECKLAVRSTTGEVETDAIALLYEMEELITFFMVG
jgi:hypothetical protein